MASDSGATGSKEAKEAYFDALDKLDVPSTDEEELANAAAELPVSFAQYTTFQADLIAQDAEPTLHSSKTATAHGANIQHAKAPLLGRTAIDPISISTRETATNSHVNTESKAGQVNGNSEVAGRPPVTGSSPTTQTPIQTQPQGPTNPRRLPRTVSAPLPTILRMGSSSASMLGKRKRKEVQLKVIPEDKQVFRGLKFFFIPPDDVNSHRRHRIKRAREHGAEWVKEWNDGQNITHVIVDMDLTYADIIKYLKVNQMPSEIIMVNEKYPGDCLKYKRMVNPVQIQYDVKGHDEALRKLAGDLPSTEPQSSQASARSLQIKAKSAKPGRWDYVPAPNTPERSDQSSIEKALAPVTGSPIRSPEEIMPKLNAEGTKTSSNDPSFSAKRAKPLTYGQRELDAVLKQAASLLESSRPKDALDDIMEEARNLEDLPLDASDDEMSPSSSKLSDGSSSFGTSHSNYSFANKSKLNQDSFSCMKGGSLSSTSSNPNARTIAVLQEMADYYNRINDTWRTMGYRKAITTLKSQTTKISTSAEAVKLPNIGARIADKIEEIVLTDGLRRLESTKNDESDEVLRLFLGIYGVGIKQASQWQAQGFKTLDDLLKSPSVKLTENQKFGIERYDDLQTRIPRSEVEKIGSIITNAANEIDEDVQIIIGGSYRRGAETCGDIDILVSKPYTDSTNELTPFLDNLVRKLRAANALTAALSVGRTEDSSKWQGCCVLPKAAGGTDIWRRIDFHLAPASELGAALIYFTGNDVFNRSIRLLARKKGMKLNQRGLYRGGAREKSGGFAAGELVEGHDERKIFKALEVPWREPTDRVC